jgi:sigma-B regulation protein RsbU (phosphoserine phosphatase)
VRRLVPKSGMAIFALTIVVLWCLKFFFLSPRVRFTSPVLSFLVELLTPLLAIPAVYYLWRGFGLVRSRFLWKISRRLILAHIFIGAIPVLLVIGIFYVSALLFYYQLSYYLISNQIGIHLAQIHAFNLSLRTGIEELMTASSPPSSAELKEKLDADSKYILGAYPSAYVILRFPENVGGKIRYVSRSLRPDPVDGYSIPAWLTDREFNGLVLEDMQPRLFKGRLFLRSFVASDFRPDLPFSIEVSVPFDRYFLGRIKAALGQDVLLVRNQAASGINMIFQNPEALRTGIVESTFESEVAPSTTSPVASIFLFPISWANGVEASQEDSDVLFVELSTSKLMGNLFPSENAVGKRILGVLQTIVIFFLAVEIASIVIGILLTRSITNAVHSLDRGTEFIKRGDFSHRVLLRSNDQLGALAASFNQMTEYVQQLVKERVQKERLERELEIAKEVQERLFPETAPQMGRLELAGICLPARTVSGDYYDFLPLGAHELGLALGDICGKGISAALLMANLQATLRSNVMNVLGRHEFNGDKGVSELVRRLNRQIYSSTAANKFASFFYAVYDDERQTLTYCNAGHNPPLYFHNGSVRPLKAGGTVVGIFAESPYEQETIPLKSGDLFLAYTDGIVECINEYGEEFGEDRLIQLVQENRNMSAEHIKGLIVERVLSWSFTEEHDDDMTLIVARILETSQLERLDGNKI